jgi:hypothetical protein
MSLPQGGKSETSSTSKNVEARVKYREVRMKYEWSIMNYQWITDSWSLAFSPLVYPNKKFCTKRRRVMHNDHYWVQIHFNMFCLFIWLNKEINLSRMNFTLILVTTEVIFSFYWKKSFVKEISFGPGPGRPEPQKSCPFRALVATYHNSFRDNM